MNMTEHNFIEEALLVPQQAIKLPSDEVEVQPDDLIIVDRTYYNNGTHGVLTFADGTEFFTVERPWLNNERRISCIPEGEYKLKMRRSPIVQRTSDGDYTRGYEITGVEGRSLIMIHVGNYVRNSAGCLLVGSSKAMQSGEPVVWSSRKAFNDLMQKMQGRNWRILFREAV